MKTRYKLTIAYDGSAYCGWQHQKNGVSIQEKLSKAINKIAGESRPPIGSGRTDAGVHALAQVAHTDLSWKHSVADLKQALNSVLPDDIQIRGIKAVAKDFHAQKDASKKWYRYVLYQGREPLLFERHYAWEYDYPLKLSAMREAAKLLVGRHDFASFQSSGASVKTTVRTLKQMKITRSRQELWPVGVPRRDGHWILFDFKGEGFLKQMVRNLVGTLTEIGRGALAPRDLRAILRAKDRKVAGLCAPARALYLMKVFY